MDLQGKTVLVTGGASGLGFATGERLVAGGARAVALDLAHADPTALSALGTQVRSVSADVRDAEAVQAAVDIANDEGSLAVVVNCAGIGAAQKTVGRNGPFPLPDFERVVGVNLIGTFNVLRLAAAAMARNERHGEERGVIVNTASVAAF